jgi:EmrB/QacA subfamily drug resistance transporter
MLAPVGLAMLFRAFPPRERVRASAILTVPTTFAPALGPVIGGVFVTDLSWRWVFYVNVPIGVAAVAFGAVFLEHQPERRPGPFDLPGFALSGLGLGSLMYGVSEGPDLGWGSRYVLATIVAGALLVGATVAVELRSPQPIIALRLLGNRLFRSGNVVMALVSVSFFGTLFAISLYYQDGRGLTALASGLSTFPEAIGVMVGAQLATRFLYPWLGPRRHISIGLVTVSMVTASISFLGASASLWWARLAMFALGLGMGQVFVPTQAMSFATISSEATGRASTLFNAVRQLGGAVGVALLTTAIVTVGPTRHAGGHTVPDFLAYRVAFLIAAVFSLCATAGSLSVRDAEAAQTMVRRRQPGPPSAP